MKQRIRHKLAVLIQDRKAPIAIAAIVVAAFFCIHDYQPRAGIIGNAMRGEIWLTDQCEQPPTDLVPAPPYVDPQSCVVEFPYRLILILAVIFAASRFVLKRDGKTG